MQIFFMPSGPVLSTIMAWFSVSEIHQVWALLRNETNVLLFTKCSVSQQLQQPWDLVPNADIRPMPDLLTRWFVCVCEKHSSSLLDYLLKYSNENYGNPSTAGLRSAEYSHIIYLALYIIFVVNFLLLFYFVLFFSANALHCQFLLSFWPRIRSRYFSHKLLLIRFASPVGIIDILHLHMKICTYHYKIISCQLKPIFLLCWDNVEVSFHQMSHYLSPPACILFFRDMDKHVSLQLTHL